MRNSDNDDIVAPKSLWDKLMSVTGPTGDNVEGVVVTILVYPEVGTDPVLITV